MLYSSKYINFLNSPETLLLPIYGTERWSHTTRDREMVSVPEDESSREAGIEPKTPDTVVSHSTTSWGELSMADVFENVNYNMGGVVKHIHFYMNYEHNIAKTICQPPLAGN